MGREVTALHANGNTFPIHLSVGEIGGQKAARFVAIIRDLSEHKATQDIVKELETHLAHADRLVVLGELTAGIAHEINQPLTAIAAFADAGARLLDADNPEAAGELDTVCKRIAEQARRAGNVVNRLRRLSRRSDLTKSSHEIGTLVRNVLLLFEHELKNSSIELDTSFEPDLPVMIVDEIQIQQVLVNLIKNSIDALKSAEADQPLIRVQAQRRGLMVEIDVLDNGPGVPSEFVNRLFEPFYTTKEHGVGLGLSICKNIAVTHGGRLTYARSETGGANFTLSLPLSYIG
jgi:two-component system sensor kinase FixL